MRLTKEQIDYAVSLKGTMKQRDAAKLTGISQSHINRLWSKESLERNREYSREYRETYKDKCRQLCRDYHATHAISPEKRAKEYAKEVHDSVIYIAYSKRQNLIKVGHTKNITRRTRELRVGSPDTEIIAIFKGGQPQELAIHDMLAQYRVPGISREWFEISPVMAIESIENYFNTTDQEGLL